MCVCVCGGGGMRDAAAGLPPALPPVTAYHLHAPTAVAPQLSMWGLVWFHFSRVRAGRCGQGQLHLVAGGGCQRVSKPRRVQVGKLIFSGIAGGISPKNNIGGSPPECAPPLARLPTWPPARLPARPPARLPA